LQDALFVELFLDEDRAGEIQDAHHRAAPGVEMNRQGHKGALVFVHPFGHAVVEAAQRVSPMIDAARLGKTGCPRSDHQQKRIASLDVDVKIIRAAPLKRLFVRRASKILRAFDGEQLACGDALAREIEQRLGFRAAFENKRPGLEEADHGRAFTGAPVEVEGDGEGADFTKREECLEMLVAAAAGKRDQIAFAKTLLAQIKGETVDPPVKLQKGQRAAAIDDGEFMGRTLRVARQGFADVHWTP
jgi:hypothetical protein